MQWSTSLFNQSYVRAKKEVNDSALTAGILCQYYKQIRFTVAVLRRLDAIVAVSFSYWFSLCVEQCQLRSVNKNHHFHGSPLWCDFQITKCTNPTWWDRAHFPFSKKPPPLLALWASHSAYPHLSPLHHLCPQPGLILLTMPSATRDFLSGILWTVTLYIVVHWLFLNLDWRLSYSARHLLRVSVHNCYCLPVPLKSLSTLALYESD